MARRQSDGRGDRPNAREIAMPRLPRRKRTQENPG